MILLRVYVSSLKLSTSSNSSQVIIFFIISQSAVCPVLTQSVSLISVHLNLCVPEQRVAAHDKMSITLCPPSWYAKQIYKAVRVLYIPC